MNEFGMIVLLLISVSFIFIVIFGCIYIRNSEKKRWNNGICPECGLKWMHFDTDSQGGRMYRCDNWHRCDVSYNVDKYR